jgi:hypothetical protein
MLLLKPTAAIWYPRGDRTNNTHNNPAASNASKMPAWAKLWGKIIGILVAYLIDTNIIMRMAQPDHPMCTQALNALGVLRR